ncbi:conserved hypothetical protein [Candidatus Sulfopaludibacter sp. SbA3]|nr:conserved hypothetical protein [Candidatus Sulfopaludibacter sp. SbA3]
MIDHLAGSIQFGDGVNGLIPPAGSNNIRMAMYQTGGGASGNKAAGTINVLKTTLPTVDKVVNWRDAEGGADPETVDSLVQRAPAVLRHRGRAVSAQDFEDLARAATPEVALVKCVPLRNLATDPDGKRVSPGTVSVIIVPYSRQHRPLPSYELIQRVWSYLASRQSAAVDLVVVGPEYLAIEITAEVALESAEKLSSIDEAIQSTLEDFLDPVNGGPDGLGWSFGRLPHRSDMFSRIHSVDGVDHVATLDMKTVEPRGGVTDTGRFLVCPGPVHVRYTLV